MLSLSPDSLVAQDPTVGPVDGLLASGEASLLLVGGRLDSLQPQASHGALGHRGPLLEVLEDQLTARGPHLLHSVRLGVVRQPTSVGDSLHHLGEPLSSEKNLNRSVQEKRTPHSGFQKRSYNSITADVKTITEMRRVPFYLLDLATRSSSSFFLIA